MATSPTQRTMKALKDKGYKCAVVEKWLAYAKKPGQTGPPGIRVDLFGIIDILALDPQRGVIGIQSCGQAFAEHYRKITVEKAKETTDWLATPGTALELWGWRKIKKVRGGKVMVWQPRVTQITLDDVK